MNEHEDQEEQPHVDSLSTKVTYLLIGGSIGALLALLLSPKPGAETRADIADATRRGIDRARERIYGARQGGRIETRGDASSEIGGDETKGDYDSIPG